MCMTVVEVYIKKTLNIFILWQNNFHLKHDKITYIHMTYTDLYNIENFKVVCMYNRR